MVLTCKKPTVLFVYSRKTESVCERREMKRE